LGVTVALINTGMRKGEVLALEWSWVDLSRGLLFIQPNKYWRPKNNKPREIPISSAMLPWLDMKPAHRDHPVYVFSTRRRKPNTQWTGGGRYATWPQLQFDRAIELAGVGGSPHVARHTFASHFLKQVPDLELLAQVLGHADTRTTKIYTHFLPEHLERARNAVNIGVPLGGVFRDGLGTVSGSKDRK
jgi:integrase